MRGVSQKIEGTGVSLSTVARIVCGVFYPTRATREISSVVPFLGPAYFRLVGAGLLKATDNTVYPHRPLAFYDTYVVVIIPFDIYLSDNAQRIFPSYRARLEGQLQHGCCMRLLTTWLNYSLYSYICLQQQ